MADDSSKPKGGAPRPRRRRTASTAVSPDVTAALANGRQRSAEVKADADSAQARADAAKAISRRVTKALGQLKIAEELGRNRRGRAAYVLDEPTTGLHLSDIHLLVNALDKLVARGDKAGAGFVNPSRYHSREIREIRET